MSTSMLAVAVLSSVLANGREPVWQNDYYRTQQASAAQKKPLAIVFGKGPNGWSKIALEGQLGVAAKQLLSEKYTCVYVDVESPPGKSLAKAVEIQGEIGIILSDRVAERQAFWHQGQLGNSTLVRYLQKYADDSIVVRSTEYHSNSRTSYYPEDSAPRTSSPASASPSVDPFCPT